MNQSILLCSNATNISSFEKNLKKEDSEIANEEIKVTKVLSLLFKSYLHTLVHVKHELQNQNQEQTSFKESVCDNVENSYFVCA
jgi:mRNA-degrading endonuclease YafQ of YafQ-DinJ toxin-antitoxin module